MVPLVSGQLKLSVYINYGLLTVHGKLFDNISYSFVF